MTDRSEQILNHQTHGVEVTLSAAPTPEMLDLLQRTIWGSRKLRYRILNIEEKLNRLVGPLFFSLRLDDRLATVCVLNRRNARLLGHVVDSFHFVMLASEPALSNRGLASRLVERAVEYCRTELGRPGVVYAYIESTTDYSLRISDYFDVECQATMPLTIFSRLWPSDDPRVTKLKAGEAEYVVGKLCALFRDHIFSDFEDSLVAEEYHVLRENGKIVSGVQTEVLNWSVGSIPGPLGPMLLKLIPHLPLRFSLDPADMRILRFSNLLVEPGNERFFVRLLEAALARHQVAVGLFLMDQRSRVFGRLKEYGRSGLLGHLFAGNAVALIGCQGLSEAEVVYLKSRPMLMSPLDVF